MDLILVNLMGVFVLAVIAGIIFKLLRLPSIIGQVLVGLGVGVSGIINHGTVEIMHMMGSLGISLLLFLVGLEMNWREVRKVGGMVAGLFFGQTLFFTGLFFLFTKFVLNLDNVSSFMVSVGLSFSSTIVVVKVLSEKKDLGSFSGRLSLGVLLLQDLLAIVMLVFLPTIGAGLDLAGLGVLFLKIFAIVLIVNVLGHFMISFLMKWVIKNSEDLILFSLAWFMVVVYLAVQVLGLSVEIGAFLAGLSLSTSWGHYQVVNKVKTLRDVFLTVFFVLLGLQIGSSKIDWTLVIALCLVVLVGKFSLSLIWSRLIGLNSRIAFLVSLNMTQVSEFSLVVMSLGLSRGLWNSDLVQIITVVGLLTMSVSSILMGMGSSIYKQLASILPKVWRSGELEKNKTKNKNHVILFGADRTGRGIISYLESRKEKYIVIDFNPEVVVKLKKRGVEAIFADAADPDIYELTNMSEAKMIISTIKDLSDSLSLLEEVKMRGLNIPVVVDAESANEAKTLYEAGASYVLFPHFVSGWHLNQLLVKHKKDKDTFSKYRQRQTESLKAIYEGEY